VNSIKRQSINFNLLACALVFLLACMNPETHSDKTAISLEQPDRADAKTYVYECSDGFSFVARVQKGNAFLFLPKETIRLPHVRSASGAKYSENQITYWSKGDKALLKIGNVKHTDCENNRSLAIWEDAKLRGVDFRAIGNEPGWNLEIIKGEKIVFIGNYGENRYDFVTPEPSIDQQARTTIYDAQNDEHELSVILKGRRCSDTMSGEAFETTVRVILDGKEYRGCGKALH
jgi:membrane-bound inhibitor of C-type lysozyme